MEKDDAREYAENRLKEFQKREKVPPMTEIVTSIITELWNNHKFTVFKFGKPLAGIGIGADGICVYSFR